MCRFKSCSCPCPSDQRGSRCREALFCVRTDIDVGYAESNLQPVTRLACRPRGVCARIPWLPAEPKAQVQFGPGPSCVRLARHWGGFGIGEPTPGARRCRGGCPTCADEAQGPVSSLRKAGTPSGCRLRPVVRADSGTEAGGGRPLACICTGHGVEPRISRSKWLERRKIRCLLPTTSPRGTCADW